MCSSDLSFLNFNLTSVHSPCVCAMHRKFSRQPCEDQKIQMQIYVNYRKQPCHRRLPTYYVRSSMLHMSRQGVSPSLSTHLLASAREKRSRSSKLRANAIGTNRIPRWLQRTFFFLILFHEKKKHHLEHTRSRTFRPRNTAITRPV